MKWFYQTFLRGLVAILPIAVTVYVVVWLGTTLESVFGTAIQWFVPQEHYPRGAGLAVGVVAVFLIGLLLRVWLARKAWELFESLFEKLPLVKVVFNAVKDMMGFFTGSMASQADRVVMIDWGGDNRRVLGLVTRDQFDDLPEGVGGDDDVAVYLPMSYQIGGFTVVVPRKDITAVDMSVEQALRYAITGAASTGKNNKAVEPKQE